MARTILIILVICLVTISLGSILNESTADERNRLIEDNVNHIEARRMGLQNTDKKNKNYRSTSSSSGGRRETNEKSGASSIEISDTSSSTDTDEKKFLMKKKKKGSGETSTEERSGWRKWHRKCTPCPDEMMLKWRDPRIKWICAGYQRARRSFKSECMMYYRNCQDGTMFTKIHDGRCKNSTDELNQGDHFFYDYSVMLSDESESSKSSKDTSAGEISCDKSFDANKYEMT